MEIEYFKLEYCEPYEREYLVSHFFSEFAARLMLIEWTRAAKLHDSNYHFGDYVLDHVLNGYIDRLYVDSDLIDCDDIADVWCIESLIEL
jgi:hypothetical protein